MFPWFSALGFWLLTSATKNQKKRIRATQRKAALIVLLFSAYFSGDQQQATSRAEYNPPGRRAQPE
jgi:cytochrome bd-type quinol oxidase subunit 2